MNIGIYSGGALPQPEEGGAFGFTETLFEAIINYRCVDKKLYIFHNQKNNPECKNSAVTFVSLADFSKELLTSNKKEMEL